MEYMGYHIMEIVFFRDTILGGAYGYIMEISYKLSYNWMDFLGFADNLSRYPTSDKLCSQFGSISSAQQMPVFCGSKLGCFFFCWLGFNPQMFSRVEGLESCSPYLWASPKIVGLDHSLSTEKVLWKTLPKWGNIRQDPSVEKGAMSVPITIIHRSGIHYVWENIPIYTC